MAVCDRSGSEKNIKALVLLSGGLDSALAARIVLEQGIETVAINFISPFCRCTKKGCRHQAIQVANEFKIPIQVVSKGREYLEVIKNPKYGYGSGMNPCLDCRIFTFRKAKIYMNEIGASFIVTGEVLGQRPMSQHRKALNLIEREAGLEGLILRPLSAKLLPPTLPEKMGWVKREKLLAIRGRSRKPQMELAKQFNYKDYACPSGGCLLTDPSFAARLRDLLAKNPKADLNDVKLLKFGRHFWVNSTKVIVGRNQYDNAKILLLAKPDDFIMEVSDYLGPVTLIRGQKEVEVLRKAACLTSFYSKAPTGSETKVYFGPKSESRRFSLLAEAVKPEVAMVGLSKR
jgi:tRNA U34 2-thiouridine synthase MnmA/TrmU